MSAAENERNGRLAHSGNKFRNCKAGFNVAAHCVQHHDKPFDFRVFLNCNKLGNNVFIFCAFVLGRKDIVSFYLPDYGKAMDAVFAFCFNYRTGFDYLVGLVFNFVLFVFFFGTVFDFLTKSSCFGFDVLFGPLNITQ